MMERKTSMQKENFYAVVEFEDGLQIIPNNWLSADLKRAVWPNFTNNKRYDKAVKLMEEPQSTWLEHPISKIYRTYFNYTLARKKLKDAEELSDLNSGTDRDEFLKKSRKIKAAKMFDEDTSNDEQSDDTSLILELPKVPEKRAITKTMRGAKVSQTDCNYINSPKKKDSKLEKLKDTSSWIQQKSQDNCDDEDLLNMSAEQSFTTDLDSINKYTETQATSMPIGQRWQSEAKNTISSNWNSKPETENFQRFVVGKLITLELKMNCIQMHQKLIMEKLPIVNFREEKEEENIDIFQDLPLQNQNDVQAMETKLMNDNIYRSQMIKQLAHVTCKDLRTSCIHLMRKIFSNDVAVHYS